MGRFLLGAAAVALTMLACSSAAGGQAIQRGTILGAYELELDGCIQRAQQAHNLALYTKCADDVDLRFGIAREAGPEAGQ